MTKRAELTEDWAGGRHTFALRLRAIEELQSRRGCGIGELFKRVYADNWVFRDLTDILKCGLIDGENMGVTEAEKLVDRFYGNDAAEFQPVAINGPTIGQPGTKNAVVMAKAILGAVMFGLDKLPGNDDAGETKAATANQDT